MLVWMQATARKPDGVCAQVKPLLALLAAHGRPLPSGVREGLLRDAAAGSANRVDRTLNAYVLLDIHINPESRVKVTRGPAKADLTSGQEGLVLLRVINEGGITAPLRLTTPNPKSSAPEAKNARHSGWLNARLVSAEKSGAPPVLGGAPLEYVALSLSTRETGFREAVLAFDVGQGTQDLGFRGECPVLFRCHPVKP